MYREKRIYTFHLPLTKLAGNSWIVVNKLLCEYEVISSRAAKCKYSAFYDTRIKIDTSVVHQVSTKFQPGDNSETQYLTSCDVIKKTIDFKQ